MPLEDDPGKFEELRKSITQEPTGKKQKQQKDRKKLQMQVKLGEK